MIQNNKKTLIYVGAIVIGSVIAYAIYSVNKKNKLELVDDSKATDDEETPTSSPTKPNPFTQFLDNPLPKSIGFKPTDSDELFNIRR